MLGDAVLYAASRATSTAFENVSRKAAWTVTAGVLFFCAFVSALIVAYQLLEPRLGAVNTIAAISAVCLLVGLFCHRIHAAAGLAQLAGDPREVDQFQDVLIPVWLADDAFGAENDGPRRFREDRRNIF